MIILTEVLNLNCNYYYFNLHKNELFCVSANIVISRAQLGILKHMIFFLYTI